jgi:hypothetical protein
MSLVVKKKSKRSQATLKGKLPSVVADTAPKAPEGTLQFVSWKNPGAILAAAVKAVPVVRYALAVAGVAAVVAIPTRGFGLDRGTAVVGTAITITFMVLLLLLAAAARLQKSLRLPAQVLTWSFLLMIIFSGCLLLSSFFFHTPRSPRCLFYDDCVSTTAGSRSTSDGTLPLVQAAVRGVAPLANGVGSSGVRLAGPSSSMSVGSIDTTARPPSAHLQHVVINAVPNATSDPGSQGAKPPLVSAPEVPGSAAPHKGQDLCATGFCP